MRLYQCDKCGKTSKISMYIIDPSRLINDRYPIVLGDPFCDTKDICGKCLLDILPQVHKLLNDFFKAG